MKEKPYIRQVLPKYVKSLFYIQNETPSFVKQVQKLQFSTLMDQSVIFIQVCPKFPLYTN